LGLQQGRNLEVLQFCRKHACKIAYAGSSTKFGDGELGRSQSPYGYTKASNTELVENFGN
jgi:UDP-glucose 4-epimerase